MGFLLSGVERAANWQATERVQSGISPANLRDRKRHPLKVVEFPQTCHLFLPIPKKVLLDESLLRKDPLNSNFSKTNLCSP